IAEDSAAARPPKRSVTKAATKALLVEVEQRRQIDRIRVSGWLKRRFIAWGRAMIPWTNILAHIAAKKPLADSGPQLARNGRTQLDSQIADAAGGVEDVRLRKGLRRTSIETGPAGPAMLGREGLVGV